MNMKFETDNAKLAEITARVFEAFDEECEAFHLRMYARGVKAYRCNDGWNDRENHVATFFKSEASKGYYWANMDLQVGDKIFIGNARDGGFFAIVDGIREKRDNVIKCHYKIP